ncbi:putative RTA1 domain protein [Astrocystis sublimbata]|nr:putative RTA1 domain protein [Astrocystis sublimbata]
MPEMTDGVPADIVPGSLYVYAPNKAAPIFFLIAYALSAIGHIWQCQRYKCWKLVGIHALCGVLFTAGYASREWGAYNFIYADGDNPALIGYIVSQVFINVCPPLLELANYHVLGRILYYIPHLAPFPPGKLLSVFGGLLAIVEGLNSLGVAFASNPSGSASSQELGSTLTLVAISLQVVIAAVLVGIAGIFHTRCKKTRVDTRVVSTPLITLYVSMTLIFIRTIYRLVEHLDNTTVDLDNPESLKTLSPLLRNEVYFYIFEATLMLLNSILWNVFHPGRFLPSDAHIHLAKDGQTEIENAAIVDGRPVWKKVAHLFTFGVLFRRKDPYRPLAEPDEYSMMDYRGRSGSLP